MLWLAAIIFLRALSFWLYTDWHLFVVIDICVLASLVSVLLKNQVSIAVTAWRLLKRQDYRRQKLQFNLAIGSDIIRLIGSMFSFFWFFRWAQANFDYTQMNPSQSDWAYLDAYILCSLLAYLMNAKRLSRLLEKIQFSSGRQALIHFVIAIFVGGFLLMMPFSIQDHQSISLVDAFFLSVSALSVTGLSPVDISLVLSDWGMLILLVLIQLGGLGVVMLTLGILVATSKRLSMNSVFLGQGNFAINNIGDVQRFLGRTVAITFVIEAIGALLLYLSFPKDLPNRVFSSIFHSISAFCNAGFSLYSNSVQNPVFLDGGIFILCVLIILGGIGFPVMIEIGKMVNRRRLSINLLTPQSRLAINVTSILLLSGTCLFFIFESINPASPLSLFDKLLNSFFYSVSSRTAGFGLFPLDKMSEAFQFFFIILMIIGACPSSTGGGVKTTTLGVLFATVKSVLLGRDQTLIYDRAVPLEVIRKALAIIFLYLSFAGVSLLVLIITEKSSVIGLLAEVVSALSTVGSSLNVTPQLSVIGKLVIMLLMLIGRFGILSLVSAGFGDGSKSKLKYPEDQFTVG